MRGDTARPKHLLMLWYNYPVAGDPHPRRATYVGGRRGVMLANYLKKQGYRVTVLAAGGLGEGEEGDVIRVERRTLRPLAKRLGPKILSDETLQSWVPGAFQAASHFMREHPLQALVSSSPPISTHVVALLCHYRFPDVPWIAGFRDGWLYEGPTDVGGLQVLNRYVERRIVRSADLVMCVTDPLTQDFRRRYPRIPQRFVTVSNGYDPEEFRDVQPATFAGEPPGASFTIASTGSFLKTSVGMRLDPLLEGFKWAYAEGRKRGLRMRLLIAGDLTRDEEEQLRRAEQECRVSFLGYVDPASAHSLQLSADLLVAVVPPRRSAATSKLFDYIAVGKPILCIGDDTAAAAIVREYRLGTVVRDEPGAIGEALLSAASRAAFGQRIAEDPDLGRARIAFSSETLAAQFADLLAHVVDENLRAT